MGIINLHTRILVLAPSTAIAVFAQAGANIQQTAAEFESHTVQQLQSLPSGADPSNLCGAVTDRLKADRLVTDRTILTCVEAYINAAGRPSGKDQFRAAGQFISEVTAHLQDRDLLRARLAARAASLAVSTADFARASAGFDDALKTLQPLHLRTDIEWMTTLVGLGQSLLSQNRQKEAEPYFLQALSYEWYTIVGYPDQMRALRDQYILAGRGLIATRRGNLQALEQIVFVPATEKDLRPELDKAIAEAKAGK
jgi:tetratricopeptide (TPR) repeat protein